MEKDLWINDFNPSLKKFLENGYDFAKRVGHLNVTPYHYLILHFDKNPPKNQIQEKMFNELKTKIKNLAISNEVPKPHFSLINLLKRESTALKPDEFIKKILRFGLSLFNPWEWGIKWVPTLELERVISSLNSPIYKGSIIIGPSGIGKKHFMHFLRNSLAQNFVNIRAEHFLSPFITKDNALKEFQKLVDESIRKEVPLLIENIETLSGLCPYDIGRDILSFLESYFYIKGFSLIGTTSIEFANSRLSSNPLWREHIDFHYLKVPSEENIQRIIFNHIEFLNNYFDENFFFPLNKKAIEEGQKYFPHLSSPGCNVSYLWEVARNFDPNNKVWIENQAEEHFSIFKEKVYKPDMKNLSNLLKSQIFGQTEAIEKIVDRLKITRVEMDTKPSRPDGVFLLLGPSGVGKTETARVVSQWLNGENVQLLKIDMSEFMESHSISKLIGSPPGYIGYDESSLMSRYLAGCSDRVILLDEIEKALPQVLNLFLQIFDEGILTDSHGIKIHFSHSIFFLTSNLGHNLWEKEWKKQVGFGETRQNASQDLIRENLMRYIPTEFLNRLDEIILYNPLKNDTLKEIAKYNLEKAKEKFLNRFEIKIEWDEDFLDWIVREDLEPAFGARHIIRNIEKYVYQNILNNYFEKKINKGDTFLLKKQKLF